MRYPTIAPYSCTIRWAKEAPRNLTAAPRGHLIRRCRASRDGGRAESRSLGADAKGSGLCLRLVLSGADDYFQWNVAGVSVVSGSVGVMPSRPLRYSFKVTRVGCQTRGSALER